MSFIDKVLSLKNANKIYVIAELGSNWKTTDDLLASVAQAKACGADAIKFQYFTPDELYGPTYQINKTFPLAQLKEKCDRAQIDFLCSAFSPEGIAQVNPLVDAHKIASSEMAHIRLLDAVKRTGKPLLLSTGGYFLADIKRSLDYLGTHPTIPLHCNIAYPAKFVGLEKLRSIKALSGLIGFSDHTTSIDVVPLYLKELGASVIEKHFNPFEFKDTPDAPHSLNSKEFNAMVQVLRGEIPQLTEENEARLMHVRRIIATKAILPGESLKEGFNMGIFRVKKPDTNGANPFAISKLEGKISLKRFEVGDGISVADVQ